MCVGGRADGDGEAADGDAGLFASGLHIFYECFAVGMAAQSEILEGTRNMGVDGEFHGCTYARGASGFACAGRVTRRDVLHAQAGKPEMVVRR